MTRYNKFIVAIAGCIVTGLVTFNVVDADQGENLTAAITSLTTTLITALGVFGIGNKG